MEVLRRFIEVLLLVHFLYKDFELLLIDRLHSLKASALEELSFLVPVSKLALLQTLLPMMKLLLNN